MTIFGSYILCYISKVVKHFGASDSRNPGVWIKGNCMVKEMKLLCHSYFLEFEGKLNGLEDKIQVHK